MRFILRVLLTLVLATTGVGAVGRQAPRDTPVILPLDGTGVISGRVVSADTAQRPVRRWGRDADDAGKWAFGASLHRGRRLVCVQASPHGALHVVDRLT